MDTLIADVAIIGAGTAGLNARREVEKRGGRPLLIEHGPYGTTCARVGCMPSKLLIAAAEAAHAIDTAPIFGVRAIGGRAVDGAAVMTRLRRERDRFVGFMVEGTEAIPEAQRLRGHARFLGPTTLAVDDRVRVEARTVIVAAGSQPFVPPPFAAIRDRVLVSDDVFELTELPESLAVIGTGVIALELGQALQRLGVRVAFFNPFTEVGTFTDPEVKRDRRARTGRRARPATWRRRCSTRSLANGDILLRWRDARGVEHTERFAQVLVAAGRRPSIAGLALEATGLPLDEKGAARGPPADRPVRRARRSSSRATSTAISRCCTRRQTKAASPAKMPCAGRTWWRTSAARRSRLPSPIRRWRWSAAAIRNCPRGTP